MKTRNFTFKEREAILNWLLKQRLRNYGYYWQDFKRLSNYATKFRKLIKDNYHHILKNDKCWEDSFFWGRLGVENWDGKIQVIYVVGQSFNEEYINLMAEILERAGIYKRRKDWLS
jgi:hypothetical protein